MLYLGALAWEQMDMTYIDRMSGHGLGFLYISKA